MSDREKVINGLKHCTRKIGYNTCEGCPYELGEFGCRELKRDALELLMGEHDDGWVSVKDRLPEENLGACIVYDGFKVQHADHYIIDGEHLWNTPDCYESEEIRGVTHWMPLPEPPKVGDDE